jgi:hypothetical protein
MVRTQWTVDGNTSRLVGRECLSHQREGTISFMVRQLDAAVVKTAADLSNHLTPQGLTRKYAGPASSKQGEEGDILAVPEGDEGPLTTSQPIVQAF